MKKIALVSKKHPGLFAIIDDEDFDRTVKFRWYAWGNNKSDKYFYARKNTTKTNNTRLLHRFILGLAGPAPAIDHINGNGLDCRKLNLRIATHQQNCLNRRQTKNKTGFVGVYIHRSSFQAVIRYNGKRYCLGYFKSAKEASYAREAKAKDLFGNFYKKP